MIRHRRQIELDGPVTALAVSGDGSLIAVGIKDSIALVDVESRRQIRRIRADDAVTGLAISSDKSLLTVATGAPTVRVYDSQTGELVHKFIRRNVPDFLRRQRQVQVSFVPHSPTVITRGEPSNDVTFWNCESGNWEHLIRMPQRSGFVVMSPNGKHVAVVSEPDSSTYRGHVTMYRVNQGLQSIWNTWHQGDQRVDSAAFSPNGSRFASCAAGDGVRVWSVESGEQVATIDESAKNPYLGAAFAGDEQHLLTIAARTFEVRQLGQDNALANETSRQPGNVRGFSTSADGIVVVSFNANAALDVWMVDKLAIDGNQTTSEG